MEAENSLIDSKTAFYILTNSLPDLREVWKKYLEEEYGNSKEPDFSYLDISVINRFVVDKFKNSQTKGFDEFWKNVELLINNGDSFTSELMVIGLIEGVQNVCGNSNLNYQTGFDNWIQPATKKAWNDLIEFWGS
jgi:hypothetical protein